MSSSKEFPGRSVISWYQSAEKMLAEVLEVVPYCRAHEGVWSPKLVTILLETCSQLDSLWAFEAHQSAYVTKKKLDIADYFEYFAEYVGYRWVVFWGDHPKQVRPFGVWDSLSEYARDKCITPDWRTAYNRLKHDRLANREKATLERAVDALGGLFLAILHCEPCRDAIAQTGWLLSDSREPQCWLGEDSPSTPEQFIVAESKLFSYPVRWCREPIGRQTSWTGPASHRFMRWFDEYEQE